MNRWNRLWWYFQGGFNSNATALNLMARYRKEYPDGAIQTVLVNPNTTVVCDLPRIKTQLKLGDRLIYDLGGLPAGWINPQCCTSASCGVSRFIISDSIANKTSGPEDLVGSIHPSLEFLVWNTGGDYWAVEQTREFKSKGYDGVIVSPDPDHIWACARKIGVSSTFKIHSYLNPPAWDTGALQRLRTLLRTADLGSVIIQGALPWITTDKDFTETVVQIAAFCP